MRNSISGICASLCIIAVLAPSAGRSEILLAVYGGVSSTIPSEVRVTDGWGLDLTLDGVEWDGEPFREPIYYGVRVGFRKDNSPVSLLLDFTHAKMISSVEQQVAVSGTRGGVDVSGEEPIGQTFRILELSHGHNLLSANVQYNWFPESRSGLLSVISPFVGGGIGLSLSHVEAETATAGRNGYEVSGFMFQFLAGIDINLGDRFFVLAEYRLSYASVGTDLDPAGSLSLSAVTHHSDFGVGFRIF